MRYHFREEVMETHRDRDLLHRRTGADQVCVAVGVTIRARPPELVVALGNAGGEARAVCRAITDRRLTERGCWGARRQGVVAGIGKRPIQWRPHRADGGTIARKNARSPRAIAFGGLNHTRCRTTEPTHGRWHRKP